MTAPHLHQIAERTINRPLLIHPDKAAIILSTLNDRIGLGAETPAPAGPDASRFFGSPQREDGRRSYTRAKNGVGVVPIIGSLVNRGAWIGASSGLVSYEGIAAQLDEAATDPEIRTIVLDIESPGGEASGMAALAAKVRTINTVKPVIAVVNDMAASAAYGIASGASRIVVSETSLTGSIGVVLIHQDHSARLEKAGVAVTIIHAGAHKVDGHPFGPLPDSVKADLQAEVAKHYALFVDLVAAGRGDRLTAEAARATEARVFLGTDAIDAGLADERASFDEVVSGLASPAPAGGFRKGGRQIMSDTPKTPAGEPEAITPEAHAAAVTQARAEGATAERERIGAILTSDEGKANPALAAHFAFKTSQSVEDAKAALAAAGPTPAAEAPKATVPSIEERAREEEGIGHKPKADKQEPWGASVIAASRVKMKEA